MDRSEVSTTVMEIINNTLINKKSIKLEHRLKEDLEMDSIGYVELSTGLEDKYSIDIPDETIENLETVEQVVDMVMNCPVYEAE